MQKVTNLVCHLLLTSKLETFPWLKRTWPYSMKKNHIHIVTSRKCTFRMLSGFGPIYKLLTALDFLTKCSVLVYHIPPYPLKCLVVYKEFDRFMNCAFYVWSSVLSIACITPRTIYYIIYIFWSSKIRTVLTICVLKYDVPRENPNIYFHVHWESIHIGADILHFP